MSTYDNETKSKTYTDLNPTAPQEPQTYRLKKLTEIDSIAAFAAFASGVGLPVGLPACFPKAR